MEDEDSFNELKSKIATYMKHKHYSRKNFDKYDLIDLSTNFLKKGYNMKKSKTRKTVINIVNTLYRNKKKINGIL